ncbi:putative Acyl-coenzyme A:6-aminopenicillanic acid acyl-transferase-containing protein 1 [Homarus americanus]|uniref:Putative Acyl-coenzyme A:6-aminopenicillanic acid acyl-transferase-containing protein 1 n=1 Tax=Homarus americanus TaxID=6706 RepID=A0A8J5N9V5_HOMAM|nr:putative Acyl-coenzyme A:6-aminopenicillanic acid acyl-transferase-containing protein 1 [Homarus americanus]
MATNISRERRNTLPIIHTRGTYYQVGYDVGHTFRCLIEDYLSAIKESHSALLAKFSSGEGKAAYNATLAMLQINFPHYIRELQGTADGARLPFYDVLLGHTEDASGELLNHSYIVSAQVREEEGQGRWGTREEHFTAFCYAGHLPGYCMGFNHHGIVYSVNSIMIHSLLYHPTARHFLCRALLSAENMAALHTILKDEGVGAADGFSVNVAMMSEDGSHTFHNLEEGSLVLESSKQRHARERECPAPRTQQLLIDLLSDTHDPTHPIFRTSDKSFMTIALGLFDLLKKTWTIWIKNPKLNDPLFSLPLTFKWDP